MAGGLVHVEQKDFSNYEINKQEQGHEQKSNGRHWANRGTPSNGTEVLKCNQAWRPARNFLEDGEPSCSMVPQTPIYRFPQPKCYSEVHASQYWSDRTEEESYSDLKVNRL